MVEMLVIIILNHPEEGHMQNVVKTLVINILIVYLCKCFG